eukprot:1136921-Pelagomonas_calceolata.AAC.2
MAASSKDQVRLHLARSFNAKMEIQVYRSPLASLATRADGCARSAALTATTEIELPHAWDPFHNFYWLSLKTSHLQKDSLHRSNAFPTHYLNILTDNLNCTCTKTPSLALLISLTTITVAGRASTMPYNPLPQSPLPI